MLFTETDEFKDNGFEVKFHFNRIKSSKEFLKIMAYPFRSVHCILKYSIDSGNI